MGMSDSFQCPKCGASYTRERRQVGKAVLCTCGHKFLVPPDLAAPPTAVTGPRSGSPKALPAGRERPPRSTARQAPSGDSSEVLPLAEPMQPANAQPAARWAEPVEPQEAPLMEAEVVYPATPYAEPVAPVDDLFGASGAYADPILLAGAAGPPLALPPARRQPDQKRKKKRRSGGDGRPVNFSNWVACFVLFLLLPAAALFTLLGLIQSRRAGPGRQAPVGNAGPSSPASGPGGPAASAQPAANEPAPSGYHITLWNAKRSSSGEFTVEYRLDRGPLDAAKQYFWVVTDPKGKIEFPIPLTAWQQRGKLSGKTAPGASGQFTGPYTTYIEGQGATRSRISNDAAVAASGG